jgi:hypothetical protein
MVSVCAVGAASLLVSDAFAVQIKCAIREQDSCDRVLLP